MRKSILLFVLFTLTSIPLLLFAQGGYQVTATKFNYKSADKNGVFSYLFVYRQLICLFRHSAL